MNIRLGYLIAAGAAAATLLTAPVAAADTTPAQGCTQVGASATECASPGNAQLDATPPQVGNPVISGAYPGPYPVPFDEGSN
jgi:hypothetical protein